MRHKFGRYVVNFPDIPLAKEQHPDFWEVDDDFSDAWIRVLGSSENAYSPMLNKHIACDSISTKQFLMDFDNVELQEPVRNCKETLKELHKSFEYSDKFSSLPKELRMIFREMAIMYHSTDSIKIKIRLKQFLDLVGGPELVYRLFRRG